MTGQAYPIARCVPLAAVPDFPSLMCDWVAGVPGLGSATAAWRACLEAPSSTVPSPAWSATVWREAWWDEFAADLPDDEAVAICRHQVASLVAGEADVIITGQQPGFLGGPLYTLFKTATCIAAAAARSAAGRPTVPLFWSGDDDDDLREAFSPCLFDPRRRTFLHPLPPASAASQSVGTLPASAAGVGEAAWLAEQAAHTPLAQRLAAAWQSALASGQSWGRLHRRALLHLFGHHGLLVVSGDDDRLHAVAKPLYKRILAGEAGLSALAAQRGERFAADGYHAQIGAESLARPFSVADGGQRRRLGEQDARPENPASLRPGVLFRSPVQDWLFRPAGVVVGPGELAYLKQTEPVYEALGVTRPPLVPRLFCTLTDASAEPRSDNPAREEATAPALAHLENVAETALTEALREVFELTADQARTAAGPNLKRWSARNRSLFESLARAGDETGAQPAWLAPGARRQERVLAMHWATALWGETLTTAVLAAAHAHLEAGASGAWADWRILVADINADSRGERNGS